MAGMDSYPQPAVPAGHVAPVPRRVRGVKDGITVVDTLAARYVWEWPYYPQWYFPAGDVRTDLLAGTADGATEDVVAVGTGTWLTLDTGAASQGDDAHTGGIHGADPDNTGGTTVRAARRMSDTKNPDLGDTIWFDWESMDAWFEEDEEVFKHPRSPYTRVDAIRSTRHVRIELDGVLLAESPAPVMVFETGLPTRYYLDRTAVNWEHLRGIDLRTACPYKGRTTGYWDAEVNGNRVEEIAWCYDFPTRQLLPIAGLVAFLNEKVDIAVDGVQDARPNTFFS